MRGQPGLMIFDMLQCPVPEMWLGIVILERVLKTLFQNQELEAIFHKFYYCSSQVKNDMKNSTTFIDIRCQLNISEKVHGTHSYAAFQMAKSDQVQIRSVDTFNLVMVFDEKCIKIICERVTNRNSCIESCCDRTKNRH